MNKQPFNEQELDEQELDEQDLQAISGGVPDVQRELRVINSVRPAILFPGEREAQTTIQMTLDEHRAQQPPAANPFRGQEPAQQPPAPQQG